MTAAATHAAAVDPLEELTQIRSELARWRTAGGEPWDLPPSAVHYALSGHGLEANDIGTRAALLAVSDPCPECHGDGSHVDDSHPANQAQPCEPCGGHGRIPKRPEGAQR